MLRRALPVVLAALVIAPAYAQTRAATPAKPGAQAPHRSTSRSASTGRRRSLKKSGWIRP